MSSTAFEVVLRPDPTLRRLVFGSGIATMTVGIILVTQLHIPSPWRGVIGAIWFADSLRELRNLRLGAARVSAVTLNSAGNIAAIDFDGDSHELTLLTGSMVLPGLAWFRVQFTSGRRYAELFSRKRAGPEIWHRLQLLWQQSREVFGHPPGP